MEIPSENNQGVLRKENQRKTENVNKACHLIFVKIDIFVCFIFVFVEEITKFQNKHFCSFSKYQKL